MLSCCTMYLHWLFFLPALALLFLPVDALLPRQLKLRTFEHIDFGEGAWARSPAAWTMFSLWLDPLRAFLGAWMLTHAWMIDDFGGSLERWVPVIANGTILALATAGQLHTRRDTTMLLAPLGYVAGLWLGLLTPAVAALAIVVGVGGIIAFRSWSAFFICGAAYAGIAGFWIMGKHLNVPLAVGLAMLPWTISAVSARTLIQPLRSNALRKTVPMRDCATPLKSEG